MSDTTTAQPAPVDPEHSAPGGAVHTTGLRRKFGKLVTLRCGCSADDTRHITMCDVAWNATRATHERWNAKRRGATPACEAEVDPLLA